MKKTPGWKTLVSVLILCATLVTALGTVGKPYMLWAKFKAAFDALSLGHAALASEFHAHVTESDKLKIESISRLTAVETQVASLSREVHLARSEQRRIITGIDKILEKVSD